MQTGLIPSTATFLGASNDHHHDFEPGQITLQDLTKIYWQDKLVRLNPKTRARVDDAAVSIRDAAEGTDAVYGVNTGFGKLANKRIALKDTIRLQRNLILSHFCGVGPPLPERIVRLESWH